MRSPAVQRSPRPGDPASSWIPAWPLLMGLADLVALCALACANVACDAGPTVREIRTTRVVEAPPAASPVASRGAALGAQAATGTRGRLLWDTPSGWTELPATSMRVANLLAGGDPRAECTLTELPGEAGGLAANVNRWRGQMGSGPLDAAAVAALPRVPFLGGQAALLDVTGTWSGMSGDAQGDGYRLLGLLLVASDTSRFLKLVGPADVVTAERDAFDALARSFGIDDGHGHAGAAHAAAPVSTPAPSGDLTWLAPAGWQQLPDRPMRVVTLRPGGDSQTECYVTILPGDAGGELANINRWRSQMGASGISFGELAQLEHIAMLEGDGVVVEVDGAYQGMAGEDIPDASLLGAICNLGDRVVFVKMIGPRARIAAERRAFAAFCRSLEMGPGV